MSQMFSIYKRKSEEETLKPLYLYDHILQLVLSSLSPPVSKQQANLSVKKLGFMSRQV